jgi:mono/diheme cytochrome c family protein
MTPRSFILASSIVVAAVAGCYTGSAVDTNRGPEPQARDTDGTEPPTDGATRAADGGASRVPSGIPCDVAALLADACVSCHGATPTAGAPLSLMTYDDLAAPYESAPDMTIAEVALLRMKSTKRPMPPTARLDDDRVAVLERWVAAELPRGSCAEPDAGVDGAAPAAPVDAGPRDAAADARVLVCSSNMFTSPAARPSEVMKPGRPCLECHAKMGGPAFEVAGTVYPTLNEPNECIGVAGAEVVITDARGDRHFLATNAVGNFFLPEGLFRPYTATVIRGTEYREMKTPQTDGDCNGCHAERPRNGAPGRIMAP